MAIWRKMETAGASAAPSGSPACYIRSGDVERDGKIPKGYVPIVLVGDEGKGEERMLVHVRMLKEPRVLELLEMSADMFGYGQRGVLRIPCGVQQFEQMALGRWEMQERPCANQ